jgi:hypothetical protein
MRPIWNANECAKLRKGKNVSKKKFCGAKLSIFMERKKSIVGQSKTFVGSRVCQIFLHTIHMPKRGEMYQMTTKFADGPKTY